MHGGSAPLVDAPRVLAVSTTRRLLAKFRVQLALGVLLSLLPSLAYARGDLAFIESDPNAFTTAALAALAYITAIVLFRRAELFPGVGVVANALPAVTVSFALVLTAILAFRLNYGRVTLGVSFMLLAVYLILLGLQHRIPQGQSYYLLRSPETLALAKIPGIRWKFLDRTQAHPEPGGIIIADLRLDLPEEWERRITEWVLAGHKVYHCKQVFEMITGRVQIAHLSENSLGSVAPSESYAALKRASDLAFSLLTLPILLPLFLIVAVGVKLESRGPVFFRQARVGYRGKVFQVIKFRTMRRAALAESELEAAKTAANDPRITRLGMFLRRARIDELPQVFNILRGDMSWIGPRPEALPLSTWYTEELPYYAYRHVVRPGITGWAQVNQGHVTELDEVLDKLHFDFYYIKKFSIWIDLVIVVRTILTVLSGFGAR